MKFFNGLIHDTEKLLENIRYRFFPYSPENAWEDAGRNEVILQRDTAFELNGTGFNLVTDDPVEDGIFIYGEDLKDINESRKFARICVIGIDDVKDEQKAYDLIRRIEFTKYHCFPKGYMIRTASKSHKEAVRVSRTALNSGINFEKTGNLYINAYRKNSAVKGVKMLFITDKSADYSAIERLATKNHSVTETLNHIMNNVNFDCSACNLKPICDEVEGMRELHFKKSGM